MTKEQFNNDETLRIKYFYDLAIKRKKLYPTSYFLFPTNTRKKSIPLEKSLFTKLISTYLDVYFNEFYYYDRPQYFMLSGKLMKTIGDKKLMKRENGIFMDVKSITWIWFLRPSIAYVSNIRLIKLKGSSSRVDKIEKRLKNNKDVSLLKPFKKTYKELLTLNKLFRNA